MSQGSTPSDPLVAANAVGALEKSELLAELLEQIRADIAILVRSQNDAHDATTHEENRAEHAKDTRSTEQSYLARGLAGRVEDLRQTERRLSGLDLVDFDASEPIGPTALVRVEDAETGSTQIWWLVPAAGGLEMAAAEHLVRTITPAAPLGRSLIGLSVGDEGAYDTPRGQRRFEVLEIA